MSKIVISLNKKEDLEKILETKIDAILLSMTDLSNNSAFTINIHELKELIPTIKNKNKEIWISLNKIMHNYDLELLENTLIELNKLDIDKILFYDLSIITLSKKLNIKKDLVIYQNHLNASIESNLFYNNLGIKGSMLTSEITFNEIKEISESSNMFLVIPVYGFIPMFYSRRFLLTNYFDHIKKNKDSNHYMIEHNNNKFHIKEEEYGTSIYHNKINYIEYKSLFEEIGASYLYFNFEFDTNYDIINEYIENKIITTPNKGFLEIETIYKVKKNE